MLVEFLIRPVTSVCRAAVNRRFRVHPLARRRPRCLGLELGCRVVRPTARFGAVRHRTGIRWRRPLDPVSDHPADLIHSPREHGRRRTGSSAKTPDTLREIPPRCNRTPVGRASPGTPRAAACNQPRAFATGAARNARPSPADTDSAKRPCGVFLSRSPGPAAIEIKVKECRPGSRTDRVPGSSPGLH
jgi:hypothetical protein